MAEKGTLHHTPTNFTEPSYQLASGEASYQLATGEPSYQLASGDRVYSAPLADPQYELATGDQNREAQANPAYHAVTPTKATKAKPSPRVCFIFSPIMHSFLLSKKKFYRRACRTR